MTGGPPGGGTSPQGGPPQRPRIDEGDARRLGIIGAIVLGIALLLIFIVENSREVKVSFVFFEARMSLIWVIVLSAVTGWVVGFLLARLIKRRFLSRPD
ncbi:MAG: DUF1049 domain-containing protein [Thermoleophilia bacterium]|nr:DUF1049 domain-containing protein [Thermoleophilia bacterium]